MVANPREIDVVALKAQRAELRKRQLSMKREKYQRSCALSSAPRPRAAATMAAAALCGDHSKSKPHRMVRTAIRGCLAKGMVETTADMPALLSMGRLEKHGGRKPSVARVLTHMKPDAPDEEPSCCSQEYVDWFRRSVPMGQDPQKDMPLRLFQAEDACAAAGHILHAGLGSSKHFAAGGVSDVETAVSTSSSDTDSGAASPPGEDSDQSLSPPVGPAPPFAPPAAGEAFRLPAMAAADWLLPAKQAEACVPDAERVGGTSLEAGGANNAAAAPVEAGAALFEKDPAEPAEFVEGEEAGWEVLPPPALAPAEEGAAGWSLVA